MNIQDRTISDELARYPDTGRFLMGRLRGSMDDGTKTTIENLIDSSEWIDGGERLLTRGGVYEHSTMLIEGFMLRTLDEDGRRCAVSFHVPGDFIDLHCFALKRLDHNLDTVGRVKVGYVPHDALTAVMVDDPQLARILWASSLLDAAMHREWIVKLEQLTVPKRLAHIFAEIAYRLRLVGLGDEEGFDTDLTQNTLSDMAGATPVHVNRALKILRTDDIADFRRGRVDIPDPVRLHAYASFTRDYLYAEGDFALGSDFGMDGPASAPTQDFA